MNVFDIEIAARTVFGEASSEGFAGMQGVAHALVNRLNTSRYGRTLATVCLNGPAFSCWNALLKVAGKTVPNPDRIRLADAAPDDKNLLLARAAVSAAAEGNEADPTGGATHYYAEGTPRPSWADAGRFTVQIGHHLFFADVP